MVDRLEINKYDSGLRTITAFIPEEYPGKEIPKEERQYDVFQWKEKTIQPAYIFSELYNNSFYAIESCKGIIISDKWNSPYDFLGEDDVEFYAVNGGDSYIEVNIDTEKNYSSPFGQEELSLLSIGESQTRTLKKRFKSIPRECVDMDYGEGDGSFEHRVTEVFNYYITTRIKYLYPASPPYYRDDITNPDDWWTTYWQPPDSEFVPADINDLGDLAWQLLSEEQRIWRSTGTDYIYTDSTHSHIVKSIDYWWNSDYRCISTMGFGYGFPYDFFNLWEGNAYSMSTLYGPEWPYTLPRFNVGWILYADMDTINAKNVEADAILNHDPLPSGIIYSRGGEPGTWAENCPTYQDWQGSVNQGLSFDYGSTLDEDRTIYCGIYKTYRWPQGEDWYSCGWWDFNWYYNNCPVPFYIILPNHDEILVYYGHEDAVYAPTITPYNLERLKYEWDESTVDAAYIWGLQLNYFDGGEPNGQYKLGGNVWQGYEPTSSHRYGMIYEGTLYERVFENSLYISWISPTFGWVNDANYHYIEGTENMIPENCAFSGACVLVEVETTKEMATRIL